MDILSILTEATTGSLSAVLNIAKIVIPLMVVMEFLRAYKVLEKMTAFFRPLASFFGMSENSSFPLLIGIIIGISYGAGLIIQSYEDGELTTADTVLLATFLVACHAVFEDTLILMAVGANGAVLLSVRIVAAVIITYVLGRRLNQLDANKVKKQQAI